MIESCFLCDGGGPCYGFDPNHIEGAPTPAPVNSIIETLANLEDLAFLHYPLPPCHGALQHIVASGLRDFQLTTCANIGYIFNDIVS